MHNPADSLTIDAVQRESAQDTARAPSKTYGRISSPTFPNIEEATEEEVCFTTGTRSIYQTGDGRVTRADCNVVWRCSAC